MIFDKMATGKYFFYSASIGNNANWIAYLEHLSSMKCKGNNMGDGNDCTDGAFAYQTNNAEGIKKMYEAIAQSILSSTTTVTATQNGSTQTATDLTPVGNNINIPIPSTFQCKNMPFTMPVKTSFYGAGTMKFDNFSSPITCNVISYFVESKSWVEKGESLFQKVVIVEY
jgi:hypothetical protein